MNREGLIFDLTREALWAAFIISAPLLSAALIIGFLIGLFQALTSVQEMTLTFVPKITGMLVVLWMSMGFMTLTIVTFFQDRLIPLIGGAG